MSKAALEEIEARAVKIGDALETEGGGFVRVADIRVCRWAKDGDGFCLEFMDSRTARGGFILGKRDLVKRKVKP